jgi:flagellar hook-length control protein FliK
MAGQGKVADPLEVLGLTPRPDSANARDAAILQALTERLAGIEETSPDSLPTTATPATTQPEAVQHRAASTETAHHSRPLQHHVGTQAWADELGTRLTMLTDKGQHTASLRLSPEHLGPLEIRIAMREDQASVWFGAAHADTRAAIEHALPRLRELFAAEGMSLADTGVFREAPNQQPAQWQAPTQNNNEPSAATETECAPPSVQIGLLDAYA